MLCYQFEHRLNDLSKGEAAHCRSWQTKTANQSPKSQRYRINRHLRHWKSRNATPISEHASCGFSPQQQLGKEKPPRQRRSRVLEEGASPTTSMRSESRIPSN